MQNSKQFFTILHSQVKPLKETALKERPGLTGPGKLLGKITETPYIITPFCKRDLQIIS